ncbi:hypothetical protein GCM10020367_35970 [Streptomyces sannanensis]|uniref:Uncharacterized protein n=1 Tax=Streptomyces sannanensis TaxID=285536 RepID=A0ABP6SD93_9ACTN
MTMDRRRALAMGAGLAAGAVTAATATEAQAETYAKYYPVARPTSI